MSDLEPVGVGGGIVGGVIGILFALRYGVEAIRAWRADRREASSGTMTDAATTNAMLLAALKEERADNRNKDARIDQLEAELEEMRRAIFEQRREYEAELEDLRKKLAEVSSQLDGLQRRISERPV